MIKAIVIVAKVINEFSGVSIANRGELFWMIKPMIDEILAFVRGGKEYKREDDEK